MKRLTVLRHAKSDWGNPQLEDFNRPLNERGWKAARRIGRELKHRGEEFDLVIASPAARVRETLDGLREKLALNVEIRFVPRIYEARKATLLALVQDLPETVHAPLLVGHNPGLQRLLLALSREDPRGLRDRISRKYTTAAVAAVELPARTWADIKPGSGEIVELIVPKELED